MNFVLDRGGEEGRRGDDDDGLWDRERVRGWVV